MPAGVFNPINGAGAEVGAAISSHPGIDMVSFTGSTRAGIEVAKAAAPTVKRVAQELGGKSPNIILEDADFIAGRRREARDAELRPVLQRTHAHAGAGQDDGRGYRHPSPQSAESTTVGDPNGNFQIGPVVNKTQWEKIQRLYMAGIDEGATLVTGGTGRPEGLDKGFYVKPTAPPPQQRHDRRQGGDLRAGGVHPRLRNGR